MNSCQEWFNLQLFGTQLSASKTLDGLSSAGKNATHTQHPLGRHYVDPELNRLQGGIVEGGLDDIRFGLAASVESQENLLWFLI